jgi:hypothetical protein
MPTPAPSFHRQTAIKKEATYAECTCGKALKRLKNTATQAVRIPKAFELPGIQALTHRKGNRLMREREVDATPCDAQRRAPLAPKHTLNAAHAKFTRAPRLMIEIWLQPL